MVSPFLSHPKKNTYMPITDKFYLTTETANYNKGYRSFQLFNLFLIFQEWLFLLVLLDFPALYHDFWRKIYHLIICFLGLITDKFHPNSETGFRETIVGIINNLSLIILCTG